VLTKTLLGVANRTLPCGTLVSFKNLVNGKTITVAVVDRGPYVSGRQWDLTYAPCLAIDHCWTGSLFWRYG
jgi:rare lipoprotein A